MKTNGLKFKWTKIVLCMFVVVCSSFVSCSNDEEPLSVYHKSFVFDADKKTSEMNNVTGTLKIDELLEEWTFQPDGASNQKWVINNMKSEYKKYEEKVRVSGTYVPMYKLQLIKSDGDKGMWIIVYSLEITTIESEK